MTNELSVNQQEVNYIDSLEVAEMTGKRHADLLRTIDGYSEVFLTNGKVRSLDYFVTAKYLDRKGEPRRKYLLTRKGCELVANKMTGEKGILFTVAYIDRFHEMEKAVQQPALPTTYKEALLQLVEQVEATEKLQAQLDEQAPAIEYHNKVLSIEGFTTIDETAKELGLRSAQQLNQMLKDKGVIKRSGRGSWLHRAGYEYLKDGYINYKPIEKKKLQMLVSQKGVKEFARLLDLI
ncbi:Rha family transcriptional regulator [Bacillus thuringiensis]|uniref:Rha family transcriptional regulator n=2 Tax=Bacillus thuringiensis TaxID=1428 RepID=UPI000A37707C|nr:Rha family transcriptional regulator [Bacillus thuringiensis]MED2128558.1 Rha family transcriptional regulator [Bacillus thuringiensis]MED2148338.1 Rha family transcriptional regulator [Bacillus thuringiensis]MED2173068.1 Rha family transcriptional regulator [Bacillus thuringiensis]MED2478873.1 Rha family transcriptional regulator [Bacillus thuringiensis]MED2575919.1 Rha family transcriptional regulator [Bacillus thuringiensis]